jgi:predicted anti-sigma-YlaC factor YlaD
MKKLIHHIRRQPEETRRHLLHIVTIIMAVVLLFLWVYSLGTRLARPQVAEVEKVSELEPFSAIKDNMLSGYENILKPN